MAIKKRYTVLTYIFNGYEKVHEVREKDPEAAYVLVTDDPNLKSDTWKVIYEPFPGVSAFGKCYQVRFHPFRFVDTPIVVRIDGSIEVRKSLKELVEKFEKGKYDRCFMIHPHRNLIPDEYNVWVKYRGYSVQQAGRCMKAMERMGYDLQSKGLIQGCFEILNNSKKNDELNDLVFGNLCLLAAGGRIERIDQTITSFVLQRFFPKMKLLLVSENIITDGELMQWYLHNSDKPIALKKDTIEPYLYDKPVKVWR